MNFWQSALDAAEKAASAAKDLGKKGLEVVEATAGEASKKLNINLHDKVGAGAPKATPPPPAELEAFGITPDFEEFVRTLNYSTFRDFPAEHLLPASDGFGGEASTAAASSSAAGAPAYRLNPWQVRHATLVVQALKEVNELRFVLCPKYMTDEHFWHVYFTLARKYLPDKAFTWAPGDTLPSFADAQQETDAFSLAGLGSSLMQLGSKIQSAAASGRQRGLELTSFGGSSSSGAVPSSSSTGVSGLDSTVAAAGGVGLAAGAAAGAGDSQAAVGGSSGGGGMLEEDPDLEAYLQVDINTSGEGDDDEGEGSGYAVGDDDLDLDSYINQLSAEVEAAAESSAAAADAAAAAGEGEAAADDAKQD